MSVHRTISTARFPLIPIVHIHFGYSDYLEFSLRQAAFSNPSSPIVLIGDRHVNGVEFISANSFNRSSDAFSEVYRHLSTNRYLFELRCFQRWFVLRDVARSRGWTEVLVCDSDVLVFGNLEREIRSRVTTEYVGMTITQSQTAFRWSASGHTSYWTIDALDDFCDFCLSLYTDTSMFNRLLEKWEHDQAAGRGGGICDMTALYLFAEQVDKGRVLNLLQVHDGSVVDLRISTGENFLENEYITSNGMKSLTFRDSIPYGRKTDSGEVIRFVTLHFQGKTKHLMYQLYQGPSFSAMKMIYLKRKMYAAASATPFADLTRRMRTKMNSILGR